MENSILQLEKTNAIDFENKILIGVKNLLNVFATSLSNQDDDKLLSRQETAKMLSISLVTLWDWTRKDLIPAYRIGNKIRYKKSEVLAALQQKNKFQS